MADKEQKLVASFKKTDDYRDICYMVDHVRDIEVRLSCLEALKYRLGLNLAIKDTRKEIKSVTIGKKGEFRVQVTECEDMFSVCAIVEKI